MRRLVAGDLDIRRVDAHTPHDATLDELLAMAHRLGVDVACVDLGRTRRGQYDDRGRLITLNRALNSWQAVHTLAHEVAHALMGDPRSEPMIEVRARMLGAALAAAAELSGRPELVGVA